MQVPIKGKLGNAEELVREVHDAKSSLPLGNSTPYLRTQSVLYYPYLRESKGGEEVDQGSIITFYLESN